MNRVESEDAIDAQGRERRCFSHAMCQTRGGSDVTPGAHELKTRKKRILGVRTGKRWVGLVEKASIPAVLQ